MIQPNQIKRSPRQRLVGILNRLLDPIERLVVSQKRAFDSPPVFIIGAPRSGSTLLHQVLVNAFRFGYLTNLHCTFYGGPYLVQGLIGRWLPEVQSPYTSTHGWTEGLLSPSECGDFWYRWFRRRPQYVSIADVDIRKLQSLRHVLIGLTDAFGLPLLFKNMLCALRLQPLSILLPEARFIFIHRDPLWVAQSLLLTRHRIHGDKSIWWSMEPPEIDRLRDLPPEEQVVRQIASIHRLIREEREAIGEERFLEVQYEDLCQDAHETVEQVRCFLLRDNIELAPRSRVPDSFPIPQAVRLSQDEFNRLRILVEKICPHDRVP